MNPYSIEGSDYLAFRATLGGELYTGSTSVHPKVTGSWTTTSSFASNSNFYISSSVFNTNTEYIYFDQVPAGIQNSISNKIKNQNLILPYSSSISNIPNADTLSPFISVQQSSPLSSSYTSNIDYVEVAFSPQNEINEDINSTLGYFNIGDYIGDPRQVSSSSETYPDLDALRDTYFKKYTHNYNIWDYIRLIKYFDNSLFKMILDWSPAHSSVATGVVLKQHLLERNKYPVPQLDTQTTTSFSGSNSGWNEPGVYQDLTLTGSISIEETIGSNGGAFIDYVPTIATSASFLIEPGQVGRIFLSQSGLNSVSFAMSSSDGGGSATTALKVYDSASLPSTFFLRNTTTIVTSSLLSGYYEEIFNFDYDFKSGYLLIANDDYSGSADITITSVTASSINGFSETTQTPSGSVEKYYTNEYEFNGELKGSELTVTDGELSNDSISLIQVYTTGGWYDGGNDGVLGTRLLFDSGSQRILYDFDPTKTYYVSFEARIWGGPMGSPEVRLVDNEGTVLFSGEATGAPTASLSVNRAEFTKGFSKLYWQAQVGSYFPTGYSASINDVYFYESIQNDSDNAPIENFVDISRPNNRLFDADYSQNSLIPVNRQVLLSESATRATVPESNYTIARSANPRYFGSKTTSNIGSQAEFYVNQPMVEGSSIGSVANVEVYSDWFAYYTSITSYTAGSDYPVSTDQIYITTLIDGNGNTISLNSANQSGNEGTGFSTLLSPTESLQTNRGIVENLFYKNSKVSLYNFMSGSSNPTQASAINVLLGGGFYTSSLTVNNPILNEQSVLLSKPNNITNIQRSTPGLLVPSTLNPKTRNKILEIAQSAGFLKNT